MEEGGVVPVGSAIKLLAESKDEIAKAQAKAISSSTLLPPSLSAPSFAETSTPSSVAAVTEPVTEKGKIVDFGAQRWFSGTSGIRRREDDRGHAVRPTFNLICIRRLSRRE